jgi:hypothetical protein
VPATVGVNDADVALPPDKDSVSVNNGDPVAFELPNSWNVTVPLGLSPPDTVA